MMFVKLLLQLYVSIVSFAMVIVLHSWIMTDADPNKY